MFGIRFEGVENVLIFEAICRIEKLQPSLPPDLSQPPMVIYSQGMKIRSMVDLNSSPTRIIIRLFIYIL